MRGWLCGQGAAVRWSGPGHKLHILRKTPSQPSPLRVFLQSELVLFLPFKSFFKGPSVSQPALLFHNSCIFSFFKTCQYLLAIVAAITAQPKVCHWQTKPLPPFLLAPATLPSNQLLLLSNPTTTIITHPKRQVLFPGSKLSACSNSPACSFTTFCAFPYHHLPTPLTSRSPFPHLKIIFKTLLRSSRG